MIFPKDGNRKEPSFRYLIYGGAALLAFICGMIGWSATASLESAAVAAGTVSVENRRRVIEHFDGGIVYAIHVREGAAVRKGAPLVTLRSETAGATHTLLDQRLTGLRIRRARLAEETVGGTSFRVPSDLSGRGLAISARRNVEMERAIFETRLAYLESQGRVLKNQADSTRHEIESLRRQMEWSDRQEVLILKEMKSVKALLDKGLARRPRYLALQRAAAGIGARRAMLRGQIARGAARIDEASLRIETLRTERRNVAASELRVVDDQISEIEERLVKAREQLSRTLVVSPVDGAVVNLRLSTIGGVVRPGEALMDIVPRNERLLIDARVRPEDIDIVRKGQLARIRMTVFDSRTTPIRMGRVMSVSADRLQDERSGAHFYLAQIGLEEEQTGTERLTPGMPVEVLINAGERTFLDYLLKPLISSFDRALKES